MSDLQMGLIILGLALIVLVVLFNWWQDYRARTRMRAHFPAKHDDPLLADVAAGERREPVLGAEVWEDEAEVDPRIEAVIDVSFAHPVAVEVMMPTLQAMVVACPKPVRLFAQSEGKRVRLAAGESCLNLQLAVLLANRAGPLSGIAWSSLWTAAQALATQFDGTIEGPELDAVVQEAAALDTLCAGLDATVNLQLRLSAASAPDVVLRSAYEAHFAQRGAHLAWVDAAGTPRFTLLVNGAAAHDLPPERRVERLDLVLDVPNSAPEPQVFSHMVAVGRDLAARIHAEVLDDQGKPLAPGAEVAIDQQLHELIVRLDHAGFTPGSARCARVFA